MGERSEWVTVGDGARLAVTLIMPPGEAPAGGWATLLEALPYRKDDLTAGYRSEYIRLADEGGFVVARVDVRGTGSSTGIATDEYPPSELTDLAEVIAWLAGQPWSNGNVGMYGTSYSGFNSLQVACERAPALKAICAIYATDDRYTDDVHMYGGCRRAVDTVDYVAYMTAMNALPPVPAVFGDGWRDEWRRRVEQTPSWVPNWFAQQTDGSYWRHGSLRPDYSRITAATMLVGGWADGYRNAPLRSVEAMDCPVEVLLGPWSHAPAEVGLPGPGIDLVPELIAWFDRWLRPAAGTDPVSTFRPGHRIFMRRPTPPSAVLGEHHGSFRLVRHPEPQAWWRLDGPADRITAEHHPVRADTGQAAWLSCAGRLPWGQPGDLRGDDGWSWCLDWPAHEERHLLGYPQLRLTVAADQPVATLAVKLNDVAPDGTSQLVSRGVLNLTHRHGSEQPVAVVPGEAMDIHLPLDAMSWITEPGHHLRLSITGADWPNVWPAPHPVTLTIWPASVRLELPELIGDPGPAPVLHPPQGVDPHGSDADGEQPPVVWRFEHDVLRRATVARVDHGSAYAVPHAGRAVEHYTGEVGVNLDDPGNSWSEATISFEIAWPESTVASTVRQRIDSTADHWYLRIELDVTENGAPFATRTWDERIPRLLC